MQEATGTCLTKDKFKVETNTLGSPATSADMEAKYDSYPTKIKGFRLSRVTEKCKEPRNMEILRQMPPDERQKSTYKWHESLSMARSKMEISNEMEAILDSYQTKKNE